MNTINVQHLSKEYISYQQGGGFFTSLKSLFHREKKVVQAVKDISFKVEEGELVGFLGPNGAGKTTTLKMLSGILYPTGGTAQVLGFVPWERKAAYLKQCSIVMGQKQQLWWDLPAVETFRLNKEIYQVSQAQFQATVEELGALLGVTHLLTTPVRKLSLGERMKCELIAALIHQPKVLFLDEPTVGLDVVSQQAMREFIARYNKERKTTILLTSHNMEDVEALCSRVIMIDHGRILYDGALTELVAQYVDYKLVTLTFTHDILKKDLDMYGEVVEYEKRRVVLKVPHEKVKVAAAALLTKLPVDDMLIGEVPVEEVVRMMFTKQKV